MSSIEISVVTPMFNEEDCVLEFYNRVTESLKDQSYELIIVDDGSTDKTKEILLDLSKKDNRLRYLSLARNRGQSYAVYCGFQHTKGEHVIMMDGDLQNLPEDIMVLVEKSREGYSLVSGFRSNRKDADSRKLPSKLANLLIRKATGCEVRDMGGFKCLKGNLAREIRIRNGYHRLLPALVHTMGGSTVEVGVRHDARHAGVSKYGTLSRAIDVFFDILMLWFQNTSKNRPLYLFGKISVLFLSLSAFIFLWLIFERQFHGIDMGTRPLFMIDIIFFLTGLGTMATALITEQISDIQNGIDDRKPYIVGYDSYKN